MVQGYVHPRFWRVARALETQLKQSRHGGAAVCVYHHGEKVVDIWGGKRDRQGQPWLEDTMSVSFSTTKGVISTLLHILADRGLVDYDQPVARYWPEFAQAGKERITVRQLLCHEAGLYPLRSRIDHVDRMLDWTYMTDMLAASAPAHEPGTANGYHALTYGYLVGEIIRRVTGHGLQRVLEEEIATPLGLDGLYIGVPESEIPRVAQLLAAKQMQRSPDTLKRLVRPLQRILSAFRAPIDLRRMADALVPNGIEQFDFSAPHVVTQPIPAANGVFTARSLAKLYAALADGGSLGKARLLSAATVQRATEIQNRRIDLVVPIPMYWRLGYHRAATIRGTIHGGFGHFGFGGSGAWADPKRRLAVALTLNSGVGTPFGDLRILRIGAAAMACLRHPSA